MPGGRRPHSAVHLHFRYFSDSKHKQERAKCTHCNGYNLARSTTRESEHLSNCQPYLQFMEKQEDSSTRPARRQKLLDESLAIRIAPDRKALIDKDLAQCIFQTGKPLSLFEDECWVLFFKKHFGYSPPSRQIISERLLDDCYQDVKDQVINQLSASASLNLIIDESTDISKNRIVNTTVLTASGESFYWSNLEVDEGKMGADELAIHAIKSAREATDGDMSKVISITTDTCSTMQALWDVFRKDDCTKHIFTTPCDSHGLQLIIKDLLQHGEMKQTWGVASTIVNFFRNAPKQYAYLRFEQEKLYGNRKALIASVITRWGSQLSLLQSLYNSRMALIEYADRDDTDCIYKKQIQASGFWVHVKQLLDLFEPIHKAQKMSEANKANISYVYQRWNNIELHLKKIANSDSLYSTDVKSYLKAYCNDARLEGLDTNNWTRRRNRQLSNLHIAAHFLHPANREDKLTIDAQNCIIKFFKQYTTNHQTALEDFLDYRIQSGSFGRHNSSWEYIDKPRLFWRVMETSSPILSILAQRLLTTIANSVPSERAFSDMNYIHSKIRNRLSTTRADKLQFLHLNLRTLAKQKHHELTDKELLEWEDEFGGLHGQG